MTCIDYFFFLKPFLTHSSFLPIILKAELKSCPPISTVKVFAVYIALHTLTSVIHTSSCLTAEVISFAAVFDYWIIWKTFSTLYFFLSKKKNPAFFFPLQGSSDTIKENLFWHLYEHLDLLGEQSTSEEGWMSLPWIFSVSACQALRTVNIAQYISG